VPALVSVSAARDHGCACAGLRERGSRSRLCLCWTPWARLPLYWRAAPRTLNPAGNLT